ncbi:MAG: hypothetical protein ACR2QS_13885 [Woeseiaceae bacterium]
MRFARIALIVFYVGLPATLFAELQNGDLPVTRWYAHIDLVEMRSSDAGRELYDWLDDEVFAELREEFGFDADQEADAITALAATDGGAIVVIDGEFSEKTEDKILAIAALAGNFDTLTHDGKAFYQFEEESHGPHGDLPEDAAFMSLAVENKLLVTETRKQMEQLLSSNGQFPGDYDSEGALLVLRGDNNFVQAGMRPGSFSDLGWDSNVLQNTEQLALLISDSAGMLAVEAQLVAAQAEEANTLASVVRGLIAILSLSDETDPELTAFLNETDVDVDGSTLTVSIVLDPEVLVEAID